MSSELFLKYITHFKKNFNVRARPLFLNGVLEETINRIKDITVFQLLPDVITENDYKSLTINATNPKITKIFVVSNTQQIYKNEKISYIRCDNVFGLQYEDIFQFFQEKSVNIILFNSIVLDFNTIGNIANLGTKQIGLLSPRLFSEIPDEVIKYNIFSNKNENNCFEFTGIAFNGKVNSGSDLYVRMVGSINILVSIYVSKFSIVNLSEIVLSYLLNSHAISNEDYITENFPILYSLPQLYFNESIELSVPDLTEFEEFIKAPVESMSYKPPPLPIEEEIDICNVKNRILQIAYREYKNEYSYKQNTIDDALREYRKNEEIELNSEIEKAKNDRLTDLNRAIEELKHVREIELNNYRALKESELTDFFNTKMIDIELELENVKIKRLAETEEQCARELESKLGALKDVIKETENNAHLIFQRDIEAYTAKMYRVANEEIESFKNQQRQAIIDETAILKKNIEEQLETENEINRRRTETKLAEYEKCKKGELVNQYQTEYFVKYNTIISEIEIRTKIVETKKIDDFEREINRTKLEKLQELNDLEMTEKKNIRKKVEAYESQEMSKLDNYLVEIEKSKLLDLEIKINTELQNIREKKISEIEESAVEYEKQLRLNADRACQIYIDSLKEELSLKREEQFKQETLVMNSKMKEEIEKIKCDKTNEYSIYLLDKYGQLELIRQSELEQQFKTKRLELEKEYSANKQKLEAEIIAYREMLLKNVYSSLRDIKTSEMKAIEEAKSIRQAQIELENKQLSVHLDDSRKLLHSKKVIELTEQFDREKEEVTRRLEKEHKELVARRNLVIESEFREECSKKLEKIRAEHEEEISSIKRNYQDAVSQFQNRQITERTNMINEFETDKINMHREIIQKHNESLEKLKEEYETTKASYGEMLRKSFNEERNRLLETERQKVEEGLVEYRRQLIDKDREGILREKTLLTQKVNAEIASLRETMLEDLERSVMSIRDERMAAIEKDLRIYRERNEEIVRREFNTLIRGIKEIQ